MPFNFAYAVNDPATANQQSHKAASDGDVTRGEYRVLLPDGRTQIVRYTADWRNGYNAEVKHSIVTISIEIQGFTIVFCNNCRYFMKAVLSSISILL